MTTIEYISIRCPKLFESPAMNAYITMAKGRVSINAFGENYDEAVFLVASHLFTVDSDNKKGMASGGLVSSMSEGPLSVSFDNSMNANSLTAQFSPYSTTIYGREFIALVSTVMTIINRFTV